MVSGVKYDGLGAAEMGTVYSLMPQRGADVDSSRARYIMLRTASDPASVLPSVRRTLRELDPSLPLSRVATVDELIAQSLQMPQVLSLLIGALSVVALVLSVVGIYGVMAHYVQQIAKDISIRLALGGAPGSVLRLIVGRGLWLVGAGRRGRGRDGLRGGAADDESVLRCQSCRPGDLWRGGRAAARSGAAGLLGARVARRSRSSRRSS